MSVKITGWRCPECGITEDTDTPHVPERAPEDVSYSCSHCMTHTSERVEMEPLYELTKASKKLQCPECGSLYGHIVDLPNAPKRYQCSNNDCDNMWCPEEIDTCVECGKPLGGSNVICHTCWEDQEEEQ